VQVLEGKHSSWETAKILYKQEGLHKFWKGATVLMAGCIPAHAAYFSVYELAKTKFLPRFHDQNDKIYPYIYALTGALATITHDTIMSPFDSTRTGNCIML
jgi:Mitochondrial carrier protein.